MAQGAVIQGNASAMPAIHSIPPNNVQHMDGSVPLSNLRASLKQLLRENVLLEREVESMRKCNENAAELLAAVDQEEPTPSPDPALAPPSPSPSQRRCVDLKRFRRD